MHLVFLIIGSKPGFEEEFLCGVYTSLPLARAAIAWHLLREHPDATFRIQEEISE
jgi:hypothetical protein